MGGPKVQGQPVLLNKILSQQINTKITTVNPKQRNKKVKTQTKRQNKTKISILGSCMVVYDCNQIIREITNS